MFKSSKSKYEENKFESFRVHTKFRVIGVYLRVKSAARGHTGSVLNFAVNSKRVFFYIVYLVSFSLKKDKRLSLEVA